MHNLYVTFWFPEAKSQTVNFRRRSQALVATIVLMFGVGAQLIRKGIKEAMHIHIYVLVVTWLCNLNSLHRLCDKRKPPTVTFCTYFNAEKWLNPRLWKKNSCLLPDLFRKCTLSTPFSQSRSLAIASTGCVMCCFSNALYIHLICNTHMLPIYLKFIYTDCFRKRPCINIFISATYR